MIQTFLLSAGHEHAENIVRFMNARGCLRGGFATGEGGVLGVPQSDEGLGERSRPVVWCLFPFPLRHGEYTSHLRGD